MRDLRPTSVRPTTRWPATRRGRLRASPVSAVVIAVLAALLGRACEGPGPVKFGDAIIPVILEAHDPLPESARDAPEVVVMPGQPATIPDAPVVKLAIDRLVPWAQVRAILAPMKVKGQEAILLVAQRRQLRAFHLDDELDGGFIHLITHTDGKICVQFPGVKKAKCSMPKAGEYIDPSFTRELVREAVNGYKRTNIKVALLDDLHWGDVVSAVGGARSCCGNRNIRVALGKDSY